MDAGLNHVAELFLAAFEGTGLGDAPPIKDENTGEDMGDALDTLALDESRQYKLKISKYTKTAVAGVKEPLFFGMLVIGNKCREPLLHHYRFLCKKLSDSSMHVVELVNGHTDQIVDEFGELLNTLPTWLGECIGLVTSIKSCAVAMNENVHANLWLASLAILLHNFAAFERRVVRQFKRRVTGLKKSGPGRFLFFLSGMTISQSDVCVVLLLYHYL